MLKFVAKSVRKGNKFAQFFPNLFCNLSQISNHHYKIKQKPTRKYGDETKSNRKNEIQDIEGC